MTKAHGVTGGGIAGNKVVNTRNPKAEPTVYKVEPGRASNIGMSVHFHKGPLQTQGGYSNPVGPSDSMGQGPGANRVTLPCGSQGRHGQAVTRQSRPGSSGEIFPGFPGRR
jgi:hypothetical protein